MTLAREEVTRIPSSTEREPVILATGPLTSDALAADLRRLVGQDYLYFYDAISPIVLAESINREKVFRQSRWDRDTATLKACTTTDSRSADFQVCRTDGPACGVDDGQGDYLNGPMTRAEY